MMMTHTAAKFQLALVTGASSGIGEELSRLLAEKGINLIIHGRNADSLSRLAGELSQVVKVEQVIADLATEEGRMKIIQTIRAAKPDLVVNNAGFGLYGDALTYEIGEQMEILHVNGNAVIEITLEAARALFFEKKKGVVLNVSSAAAFPVFPCMSLYSASKALVNQFSESFDEEMRPYGIRILSACPGMVDTNFRQRAGGNEHGHGSHVMTARFASEEIWRQITHQKKLHIFNWIYRLDTFLVRYLLPKSWVSWAIRLNISKRHPPQKYR